MLANFKFQFIGLLNMGTKKSPGTGVPGDCRYIASQCDIFTRGKFDMFAAQTRYDTDPSCAAAHIEGEAHIEWQSHISKIPQGSISMICTLGTNQYIPCWAAAAMAATSASGLGLSATRDSVVSTLAAMEAAFSREERVTLVGSTMPAAIMSTYCSV